MKKNILYTLLVCIMVAFSACSDDYADNSKKHVYGPDENPPVKSTQYNRIATNLSILAGSTEASLISITPYAKEIEESMGMTIDELMNALSNGTVKICAINPNRGVWDKTPANFGTYGWYFTASAVVCSPDADDKAVTAEFDIDSRAFKLYLNENVTGGTLISSLSIGFVLTNDSSYETNIHFAFNITATDKSVIEMDIIIPDGDYNTYVIEFESIAENIEFAFGCTVAEFTKGIDPSSPVYDLYMMDESGNLMGGPDSYTANAPGYWMNDRYEICAWGADGFQFFVECSYWDYDTNDNSEAGTVYVGRAPGIESGTEIDVKFAFVSRSDKSKTLTFLLNTVME